MAARKFLNDAGLEHLSSYVNAKLTVVSTMPSASSDLRTVLYIGPTTADYEQGGIYLLNTTTNEWVLISTADVSLYETSFTGTQAEWDALSAADQARYEIVNITDDFVESEDATGVVAGYYYNGNFYEDSAHTTQISGLEGYIYIDLTEDKLYLYDGSQFVISSGAGGGVIEGYYNSTDGKFYEESTFVTEITGQSGLLYVDLATNNVYRYDTTQSKFIAVSGGGLTEGFGIKIDNGEISTRDFVGTQAQWDALTAAQKAEYEFIHITDDSTQVVYKPGHSISDGTSAKTQRDGLVFEGFNVTDDSTNEVTKVAEVPYTAGDGIDITNKEITVTDDISRTWSGTQAQWNAITDKSPYDGWVINITDDAASGVGVVVDTVADGNMNAVTSNAVYDTVSKVETQVFNSNFKITRCGRLRTLTVNGMSVTVSTGSLTGLGNTLPEKDWPANDYVMAVGNCRGSDSKYLPMYVTLHNNNFTGFALDATATSGYCYMTGTPDLWFSMTYIAKE